MINWNAFLFNFIILFLQILIIVILLKKSSRNKSREEASEIEIQIKYLALHHFKQYMKNKMMDFDTKEIEDYLVESIMLESEYCEDEIRIIIKPFILTLIEEFCF